MASPGHQAVGGIALGSTAVIILYDARREQGKLHNQDAWQIAPSERLRRWLNSGLEPIVIALPAHALTTPSNPHPSPTFRTPTG